MDCNLGGGGGLVGVGFALSIPKATSSTCLFSWVWFVWFPVCFKFPMGCIFVMNKCELHCTFFNFILDFDEKKPEDLVDNFFPAMSLVMLILQLLGNCYGLSNSVEFDTGSGGCILCLSKMSAASTRNNVGHHHRGLGMCIFGFINHLIRRHPSYEF